MVLLFEHCCSPGLSTGLIRPQFPVFLLPRPHFCSQVHMAPQLLHSSGCTQMTRYFQQGFRPIQPVFALDVFLIKLISFFSFFHNDVYFFTTRVSTICMTFECFNPSLTSDLSHNALIFSGFVGPQF